MRNYVIRVMRNGITHQWALVLEPDPPEWPFGETLIFAVLPPSDDAKLKSLCQEALVDALLEIAHRDGVENHALTGDIRDMKAPFRTRFNVRAEWTGIGNEAGLASNRVQSLAPPSRLECKRADLVARQIDFLSEGAL